MPLAPADRSKLARVLGLLGSDHAGERDAAGLAAHRLVIGRGLGWDDVLARPAPEPRPVPDYPMPPRAFVAEARACLRHPGLFSAWEVQFLGSIATRRRLSAKQLGILAGLVERLRAQGLSAG